MSLVPAELQCVLVPSVHLDSQLSYSLLADIYIHSPPSYRDRTDDVRHRIYEKFKNSDATQLKPLLETLTKSDRDEACVLLAKIVVHRKLDNLSRIPISSIEPFIKKKLKIRDHELRRHAVSIANIYCSPRLANNLKAILNEPVNHDNQIAEYAWQSEARGTLLLKKTRPIEDMPLKYLGEFFYKCHYILPNKERKLESLEYKRFQAVSRRALVALLDDKGPERTE